MFFLFIQTSSRRRVMLATAHIYMCMGSENGEKERDVALRARALYRLYQPSPRASMARHASSRMYGICERKKN